MELWPEIILDSEHSTCQVRKPICFSLACLTLKLALFVFLLNEFMVWAGKVPHRLPGDGLIGSDWISELWPDQITPLMGFSMMALMGGGDTWEVALSWSMFHTLHFFLCFFPAMRWIASDTTFSTHGSLPHLMPRGMEQRTDGNLWKHELHWSFLQWEWLISSPYHSDAKQTQWCKKSKSYYRKNGQGV